jgi:phosphotransferase system HPr (HPr) family protein
MSEQKVRVNNSSKEMQTALLVQLASRFSATIKLSIDDKVINAKSIMGVMALGKLEGQELTIHADGVDENDAVREIAEFLV